MIREFLLRLAAMSVGFVLIGGTAPVLVQASSAAETPTDDRAATPGDSPSATDAGGRAAADVEDQFDGDHPQADRAWLGVELIDAPRGVRIGTVVVGSPAFKTGLRPGDFLISVNGEQYGSAADVVRAIGELSAGDKVKLELDRQGEQVEMTVTLARRAGRFELRRRPFWGPWGDLPAELQRMRRRVEELEEQVESLQREIEWMRNQRDEG